MRWNLRNYQDEAARRECAARGTKLGRWPGDPEEWHHEHKPVTCCWSCLNGKCPCGDGGDCECACKKQDTRDDRSDGSSDFRSRYYSSGSTNGVRPGTDAVGGGVRHGPSRDVDVSGVVTVDQIDKEVAELLPCDKLLSDSTSTDPRLTRRCVCNYRPAVAAWARKHLAALREEVGETKREMERRGRAIADAMGRYRGTDTLIASVKQLADAYHGLREENERLKRVIAAKENVE